ncbi:MAG: glycosyltransferase family 4 protein [Bifidobacteriaceae bacterium]|nr:glycosyltransferase family 4 protein [Bifidobacteriaceae bacterium]
MTSARIVFLSANNNVLDDARLLRYVAAAGQFGYEVVAVGTQRWGGDEEHDVPGGRVLVRRLPQRFGGRGLVGRMAAVGNALAPYALKADPAAARALAAFLARDAAQGGGPQVLRWLRRLHSKMIAGLVKARLWAKGDRQKTLYSAAAGNERKRARRMAFYRLAPWAARWRTVAPDRIEEELALGPVLDRLKPALIHVHDVYQMGVAVRAQSRAAAQGRRIHLVYDAREFVPGLAYIAPRQVAAHAQLEAEYIGRFERVISVSEPMARRVMRRYRLDRFPDIVMNAPVIGPRDPETPDIRDAAGVAPGVPLMIYGGGVHPGRGIHTAVQALALLPAVHLVVVIRHLDWMPDELMELALQAGAGDRLHAVPFVPHDQVVHYFASADIGLSPLLRVENHDVTVTNKFYEYIVAGLPIVTSDTPAQAELVAELDLGAVHKADDPADLARAVESVLGRLNELKSRISGDQELRHRFSWEGQLPVLERVYEEVLA